MTLELFVRGRQTVKRRKLANFVLSLAILFLGASSTFGQAFSVPISDEVLEFELKIPAAASPKGHLTAKVRIREGEMVTIRDGSKGYKYALLSSLDAATKNPTFLLVEILNPDTTRERVRQLGVKKDLVPGAEEVFATPSGRFELQYSAVEAGYFPNTRPVDPVGPIRSPAELKAQYGKAVNTDCCVRCYSITICATSVDLDCGSCDSGGARYQ